MRRRIVYYILGASMVGLAGWLFLVYSTQPSNYRNWTVEDQKPAYATFDGDLVTVHNARNFSYVDTAENIVPAYYDRTYDLNELETVWFAVNPFKKWRGIAHTFVSFGFSNGDYLSVSVETRMEQGEKYSPIKGLFNEYELIYQVGDENDFIKVRTNYRVDEAVHLYPIKTTKERMRATLISLLERTNQLKDNPEFYNTITNNCTSNLVDHVNQLIPGRIPKWSAFVLFPGYSDHLAYKLGLIDTDLPWEDVREYYYLNDRAKALNDVTGNDFSKAIREFGAKASLEAMP